MIRRLKTRPRSDGMVNEQRGTRRATGKLVYLGVLAAFAIAVLNFLIGDLLFFEANGLVLKDRTVIATTYVARVEAIHVKEGERVEKGQPLLTLQSTEILERIADLSARRAQLVADIVEFEIRSNTVAALLPLAQKRETETTRVVSQFDRLSEAGLATASSYDTALTASFNAQEDRIKLASQLESLKSELATLDNAHSQATQALENLRAQYAEGRVDAPVSGSIGVDVPPIGQVYRIGEPIMSIYSNEEYVLAYLPHRYLFSVEEGKRVDISNGKATVSGVITEILPLTDALAKEFQNTFKPTDRNRLAKIRLTNNSGAGTEGGLPFALNEKVIITSRYF